jgi:hypothetical protein
MSTHESPDGVRAGPGGRTSINPSTVLGGFMIWHTLLYADFAATSERLPVTVTAGQATDGTRG